MGLLDDAIREHLELKRKRGGDPSEVARQEHEALGPVHRTDDPAEAADLAAPPPAAEPEVAYEPEPAAEPETEPAPVAEAPPVEAVEAPLPDHLGQPTVEFSVEEHLAGAEAPAAAPDPATAETDSDDEAEDVLDQTPDFLQETPEHDRLWFEQKPPRDFDFDG